MERGQTPVELEKVLSMSMDIPFGDFDMIYFAGRHAMERTAERLPVRRAGVRIGSVRGYLQPSVQSRHDSLRPER